VSDEREAAGQRRQAELARRARFEAESQVIRDLDLDVRILARGLYGQEGRDPYAAVRAIDRMTAALATLRGQLAAELDEGVARIAADHPEADFGEPTSLMAHDAGDASCPFTADGHVQTAFFARLAVTEAQILQLNLPTRPTKQTDTRARGFGGESVEVDAIPPTILRQIVEDAITRHIGQNALRVDQTIEQQERRYLSALIADRSQT
jgi:hypothetical protein